ncbi:MAG: haloacid dehalogenase [Chloroflexi bacterium]|nr:haloacid dehalogenase [Chloroflexota bacterium]
MPSKKKSKGKTSKLPTANLEEIAAEVRKRLSEKDAARETALRLCREVIRHSANSIRAVHRHEFAEAERLLQQNRLLLDQVSGTLREHQDLFHTGLVHDSQKEFAEANIVLCMVTGAPVPTPEDLRVGVPAFLNGLGEAAGEMRRYLLDLLRRGSIEGCEDKLSMMDDIYAMLVTMDFPDALTAGLRRTTDMVRGVLERTRGDLTLAQQHRALEEKLDRCVGSKSGTIGIE